MLTEPGVLPRDYEELDGSKLPVELSQALAHIQSTLLQEEDSNMMTNASTNVSTSESKGKLISEKIRNYL